jgi:diguanylate cyclase (GGDEF)-like protein
MYLRLSCRWAAVAIVGAMVVIFFLDRNTGDTPVQHLYYLPIILAALEFGASGGVAVALGAVLLYHLANDSLFSAGRGEADIVQVVLFIAIGVVTAKLASDAERMRRLASTDDLTGLHNLRSFEARLADMLRVAQQTRTPVAMVMLDIDHLKSLNDRHGHLVGAAAVRTVGHVLAERLTADAVACRYGGDEFVVALPDCDVARGEAIALELCRAVNALAPELAGYAMPVGTLSISVGVAGRSFAESVALAAGGAETGEVLFREADAALYRAKAEGRNLVRSTRGNGAVSIPRLQQTRL